MIEQVLTSITDNKNTKSFQPNSKSPGIESDYNIDLKLNSDGVLQINSTVLIKNTSRDAWDKLVFYFIPNMFTEKNSPDLSNPAVHHFNQIIVNGKTNDFELNKDILNIPLDEELKSGKEIEVEFVYDLTMPDEGLRLTKEDENYYLAQFYPMMATYRDNKWNKEPFLFRGETYHTSFSDFEINYDIPDAYTIVSTSEDDQLNQSQGSLIADNVKEVFIALLKKPEHEIIKSGNTTIRVFGKDKEENQEIAEEAAKVFSYYQEEIGPYPFKQLDIVIGTMGMEYPGIVTVGDIYDTDQVNSNQLKSMVAHEIAHQWFYGIISNDPYHDAWLDEGFATFAQGLYHYSTSNEKPDYHHFDEQLESLKQNPINLPLDQYDDYSSNYIYGKSNAMLWKLFENRGGIKAAENFLKSYYHTYKYKEVDSAEFVRFTKYYFGIKDTSEFEDCLEI